MPTVWTACRSGRVTGGVVYCWMLAVVLNLVTAIPAVAQANNRLELLRRQHAKLRNDHLAVLNRIKSFCVERRLADGIRAVDAAIQSTSGTVSTTATLPETVTPELLSLIHI